MSEGPHWNAEYKIHQENLHLIEKIQQIPETRQSARNSWRYLFGVPHDCDGSEWHPFVSTKNETVLSMATIIKLMVPEEEGSLEHETSTVEKMEIVVGSHETEQHIDKNMNFLCAEDFCTEPCFQQEIERLLVSSSKQVENYCAKLKLSEMSNDDVLKFCNCFSGLTIPISTSLGSILFQHCIYSKVVALEDYLSRAMSTAIVHLAVNFPVCIIEGLVIPCITNIENGPYQRDILEKIFKSLPEDYLSHCILKVAENLKSDEDMLPLLQVLIDRKAKLEDDCLNVLVAKLRDISASLSQNTGFGKLLVSILVTLEGQFSQEHLRILKEAVSLHKTFLSKTANRLLQKQVHVGLQVVS